MSETRRKRKKKLQNLLTNPTQAKFKTKVDVTEGFSQLAESLGGPISFSKKDILSDFLKDPDLGEITNDEATAEALSVINQKLPAILAERAEPGPPGEPARVEDVVDSLKGDVAFIDQIKGQDAESPSMDVIQGMIQSLIPDVQNGRDADVNEVAEALKGDVDFVDSIKGQDATPVDQALLVNEITKQLPPQRIIREVAPASGSSAITVTEDDANPRQGVGKIDFGSGLDVTSIPNGVKVVVDLDESVRDVTTVTSTSVTLTNENHTILVDDDTAGAAVTVTLPAASTGQEFHIKKLGTTADVTVDGNASETIDGATTATLTIQYESITIVSDGSNWHII